ncbi:substrate-binding periplasmic protein [Bdellovibrio sp. HCB117]|uniref:substrate-binding periplasmic protein n=1 Tax=Bdellovibrio sp. HCB117 TaxID=3394359 RepID=UPI0039B3C856
MKNILPGLLFFLALALSAKGQSHVVVGHDFDPFYYSDAGPGIQGACYDILKKLCESNEESCKFKIAPLRNMLRMLKEGEADIGCPLGPSPQRGRVYYYSEKVFDTRYSFFARPAVAKKIKDYDSLSHLKVGVFSPSMTEVSLQQVHEYVDKKFKIYPEKTVINTLRKVENNSYDLAYANADVAKTWIKKNRSKLVEVTGLGEPTEYSIVFSRKKFSALEFQKFQTKLRELQHTHALDEIAAKHGLKISLSEEPNEARSNGGSRRTPATKNP